MNYIEYHELECRKQKILNTIYKFENKLDDITLEILSCTSKFQENAISKNVCASDKTGSLLSKKIDLEDQISRLREFLIKLDTRIAEAKLLLKKSKDIKDIIYVLYYLDRYKPSKIAINLAYSRSYIYNLITEIKSKVKEIEDKKSRKS